MCRTFSTMSPLKSITKQIQTGASVLLFLIHPYGTWHFFFFKWTCWKVHLTAADEAALSGALALPAHLKFGLSEGSLWPPRRGYPRSNVCTKSQQATPIPVVTNENVRPGLIHLSATLCRLVKPQKCVAWPSLTPHLPRLVSVCVDPHRCKSRRDLGCHPLSDVSSWVQR